MVFALDDHKVACLIDEEPVRSEDCVAQAAGACPQRAIVELDD